MKIHRVKSGESYRGIAEMHGVPTTMLCDYNGVSFRDCPYEGEELLIPESTRTVCAKRTDTLESIADRFGVNCKKLIAMNPGKKPEYRLIEGEPIGVRFPDEELGMIVTNGYFYKGCSQERLRSALNYTSFITVCACSISNGEIRALIDEAEVLDEARRAGATPIMRAYLGPVPSPSRLYEICSRLAKRAKSYGYAGIALSRLKIPSSEGASVSDMLREARAILSDLGLGLTYEVDEGDYTDGIGVADLSVLAYDKLHLDPIPTFTSGEDKILREVAERADPSRILIDLSPFAYKKDKYIGKEDAVRFIRKRNLTLRHDDERGVIYAEDPTKDSYSLVLESLENLKAKLRLISELGFMGISFDIARTPINELLAVRGLFGIAGSPSFFRPE